MAGVVGRGGEKQRDEGEGSMSIDENGVDVNRLNKASRDAYFEWLRLRNNPLGMNLPMPRLVNRTHTPPQAMIYVVLCRICKGEVYRAGPIRVRTKKTMERLERERRLAFVKHRMFVRHDWKYKALDGSNINQIDANLQVIWVDAESGDDELEIQGTDIEAVAMRRALKMPGVLQVMRELGGW